jgi:hypothetical protein
MIIRQRPNCYPVSGHINIQLRVLAAAGTTLLWLRTDAEPLFRLWLQNPIREAFIAVAVLAAIIVIRDDSRVVQHELDLAGQCEEVPLSEQVPDVIHDDRRQADTGRPAAVPRAKSIHRAAQPVPVLVVSIWHSRMIAPTILLDDAA